MAFSDNEDLNEGGYPESEESRTLLTIVGDNAKIEGKLTVSQSIEIDCEVKGEMQVDGKLIVQENGMVNADVKTIDAQIIGTYEGNMEATGNVEIKETGRVNGSIKTDSLIINKGGIFSGNVIRISDDKSRKKTKKESTRESKFEEKEENETGELEIVEDKDLEL